MIEFPLIGKPGSRVGPTVITLRNRKSSAIPSSRWHRRADAIRGCRSPLCMCRRTRLCTGTRTPTVVAPGRAARGRRLLQFGITGPVLRSEHQSMDGWIVLEEKTVAAIGIRLLAESALRALKGAGASKRTLKVYECTGFGELCRR